MPIREYYCRKCGKQFENLEIEVETGKVVCPSCGSKNVERRISLFSSSSLRKSSCDVTRRYT